MKVLYKAIVLLFALSTLVGCAGLNQIGVENRTEIDTAAGTTGVSTTQTSSAPITKEPPVDDTDMAYYQSAEYKSRFPVRSDLVWNLDPEYQYDYGIGVFPFWLCEGTPWGGKRLFVYSSEVWQWESLTGKTLHEEYLRDYGAYLTDHKFVVKVYVCGVVEDMSYDDYPGDYYNATELGITDDATREAFLKVEEDHFESLGYEVIRNHSVYHDRWGDFILVAMNLPEAEALGESLDFNTRVENEMYVLTIPEYSELGMYEEE